MRITLATEAFYPAVDGRTRTVKAVTDRLVDLGHRVQVVAAGPGLASYRGCPVVRSCSRRRAAPQLQAALAEFGPDLVHVLGTGAVARAAGSAAADLGVPVTALEPPTWQPGVDPAAFNPVLRDPWLHRHWSRARSRSGHPLVVVGFAGRLEPGHVGRFAELATLRGIRPVVVGDGPLRARLRARLPDAAFTGDLDTGDLAVALASMDLLVHPGTADGCCTTVREAAASGTPVVAPSTAGHRGVVRHLETGVLYEPGRPGAVTDAVASVAADPHRALLGRCARARVAGRDWRVAVDELLEVHYPRATASRPRVGVA